MDRWFPVDTDRLLLREFCPSDASSVHEYASDPQVARLVEWGPNDLETTNRVFNEWLDEQNRWPRDSVTLAVEFKKNSKLVGAVHLAIVDIANATAFIGYVLNREYWGQGFATEAARAVVDRAFRIVGLHRVWATCDARNVASARVLEKLGMRREALHLKDLKQKSEWRDSYVYAILADEWVHADAQRLPSPR